MAELARAFLEDADGGPRHFRTDSIARQNHNFLFQLHPRILESSLTLKPPVSPLWPRSYDGSPHARWPSSHALSHSSKRPQTPSPAGSILPVARHSARNPARATTPVARVARSVFRAPASARALPQSPAK